MSDHFGDAPGGVGIDVLRLNAQGQVFSHIRWRNGANGIPSGLWDSNDEVGRYVDGTDDLDGDGLFDAVVGAKGDDDAGNNEGAIYVLLLNGDDTVKDYLKISGASGLTGLAAGVSDMGYGGSSMPSLDYGGTVDLLVGAARSGMGGTERGALVIPRLSMHVNGTVYVRTHAVLANGLGGIGVSEFSDGSAFGLSAGYLGEIKQDGYPYIAVGCACSGGQLVLIGLDRATLSAVSLTRLSRSTDSVLSGLMTTSAGFGVGVAVLGNDTSVPAGSLRIAVSAHTAQFESAGTGAVYILELRVDHRLFASPSVSPSTSPTPSVTSSVTPSTTPSITPSITASTTPSATSSATATPAAPGVVRTAVKIGHGVGGPGAPSLQNSDGFGFALSAVGDIDRDGVQDVAVGAIFGDDGASNSGSLWVLLMNSDGTVRASQEISST